MGILMRWPAIFLGSVAILISAISGAEEEPGDRIHVALLRVGTSLDQVAKGEALQTAQDGDVSALIDVVEEGSSFDSELAIRALGQLKERAAAGVPALCGKLEHPAHGTRRLAAAALAAIGSEAVVPLRAVLKSPSSRARAAAINVLGRLRAIDVSTLRGFADDPDARVRTSVAKAASVLGRDGIALTASLVNDSEVPVASYAVLYLGQRRDAPDLAVPALIEALSMPAVRSLSAQALGLYGRGAQRALPALIANYPYPRLRDDLWHNQGEEAVKRIGVPDERDAAAIADAILFQDEDARIVGAESLQMLGTLGRKAAPAIEVALGMVANDIVHERSTDREDDDDNAGRIGLSGECLLAALWSVTHDVGRFRRAAETYMQATGSGLKYWEHAPWSEFSDRDWSLLDAMQLDPKAAGSIADLKNARGTNEFALSSSSNALVDEESSEDKASRSGSTSWNWNEGRWTLVENYGSGGKFVSRSEPVDVQNLVVEWRPVELDRYGNTATVAGQLLQKSVGAEKGEPVHWSQGVTVCLSKERDQAADWSRGVTTGTTVHDSTVVDGKGQFLVRLDLRKTDGTRAAPWRVQAAVLLAKNDAGRVTFTSEDPIVPSSLQMLTVPAATTLPRPLEMLDRAAGSPDRENRNGCDLIRAVNELQRIGRRDSIDSLRDYLATADYVGGSFTTDSIFWVTMTLFEPADVEERISPPANATDLVSENDPQYENWPLGPMAVVDDVPFLVGHPIGIGGLPEWPSLLVGWAETFGVVRDSPLSPTSTPFVAAEKLISSRQMAVAEEWTREYATDSVMDQALGMAIDDRRSVSRILEWPNDGREEALKEAKAKIYRWNAKTERFESMPRIQK